LCLGKRSGAAGGIITPPAGAGYPGLGTISIDWFFLDKVVARRLS